MFNWSFDSLYSWSKKINHILFIVVITIWIIHISSNNDNQSSSNTTQEILLLREEIVSLKNELIYQRTKFDHLYLELEYKMTRKLTESDSKQVEIQSQLIQLSRKVTENIHITEKEIISWTLNRKAINFIYQQGEYNNDLDHPSMIERRNWNKEDRNDYNITSFDQPCRGYLISNEKYPGLSREICEQELIDWAMKIDIIFANINHPLHSRLCVHINGKRCLKTGSSFVYFQY